VPNHDPRGGRTIARPPLTPAPTRLYATRDLGRAVSGHADPFIHIMRHNILVFELGQSKEQIEWCLVGRVDNVPVPNQAVLNSFRLLSPARR
jgi:hypothetical protein